jgi:DnaJ-class molecular chaperone
VTHGRFLCAGDDLATEVHVGLTEAMCGGPVTVLNIHGKKLSIQAAAGTVLVPESLYRCAGEGLPLPHDPSQRGDLFVKVHVHFPKTLSITAQQVATLRTLLSSGTVELPAGPHDAANQIADVVNGTMVPTEETEFGASDTDDKPLLCAQQ